MAENILHLNDSNFDSEISKGVALVDFYADWCGPCKMMSPVLEELAGQMSGKVKIVKIDIEAAPSTTEKYEVTSIPTIILFKEGKEVNKVVGVKNKDALRAMIEEIL